MTWVFMHSPATGNDRLVLLTIADEADDQGLNARPSVRRIARKSRASVATAIRCTATLEAGGELLVLRPEIRGRGRYNRYAVVMGREPLELAGALGWPAPQLSGAPEEWVLDDLEVDITPQNAGQEMVADCDHLPEPPTVTATKRMVADCDHSSDEERAGKIRNGVTSARQSTEKRAGMVAPDARRSLVPCSIDPRVAAPESQVNPPARAAPRDVVPDSLATGAPPRRTGRDDPLDGITDAAAAIAERARARQAEVADKPRLATAPWADLRRQLQAGRAEADA